MKNQLTFLSLLLFTFFSEQAIAQQSDPKFGKYSAQEQQMTFCEFEPEADAVVLFESGTSIFVSANLHTDFHFRKKLFNKNSHSFGDVTIRYYFGKDGQESISKIKAQTVNWVNGKKEVTKLTKNEIFEVDADNGYKEYRLVFPDIKEGSIIEYTYSKIDKNITFPDGWSFQNDIPTLRSKYSITIPGYLDYQYYSQGVNLLTSEGRPTMKNNAYVWELKNLHSIRPEPYLNNFVDYLDKVQFQLHGYKTSKAPVYGEAIEYKNVLSTWEESAKDIMKVNVISSYFKNNSSTQFLKEIEFEAEDQLDLLYQIKRYVQENYEAQTSSGIIPTLPIKDLSLQKSGNKAAINLLLIALLRANDIDAYPLLISSKGNGRSKLVQYPFIGQFNQMIVVAEIEGKPYYLDGATKGLTPGYLALDNHVEEGFLLKEGHSGLVSLSQSHKSGRTQSVNIKLSEDNKLAFDYHSRYNDYDALELKKLMGENLNTDNAQRTYFTENDKKIEGFTLLTSAGNQQQVDVHYKVLEDFDDQVQRIMITPFDNLRLKENPFKDDVRLFPVDFNFTFNDFYVANIQIPDGYELDDYPENVSVVLPDSQFKFTYSLTPMENEIIISSNLNLKSSLIQPSGYHNLKTFIEIVLGKFKEPILLKKIEAEGPIAQVAVDLNTDN